MGYIDRQAAIDALNALCVRECKYSKKTRLVMCSSCELGGAFEVLDDFPSADVEPVVRCKDCVHQTKFWHNDGRMKNGGYYICGCDLVDGYSHVRLDDDFCSRGARMDGEQDDGKGND